MKPVPQTRLSDNDNKIYGNCWEACLASLLEIPIEDVPELNAGDPEDTEGLWVLNTNTWLATRGLMFLEFPSLPPDDYAHMGIDTYHIIIGPSPRKNGSHAVVGRNGKIVHDPHPDKTGLLNGKWMHAVLVKTCQ